MNPTKNKCIVVAMSGGVDSSAAAIMLHEQGYSVIGVSMQVWDYRKASSCNNRASCCAPSDFDDARIIAEKIGFPFYVFDFEETFEQKVIKPFIEQYKKGQTPNPCLDCNQYVKFMELRKRAKMLGADLVATGHYARIDNTDGTYKLSTATDLEKDQSYFLYRMSQEELATTLFPLGKMKKEEVRNFLSDRNIKTAQKKESQDICFVTGSVAEFVAKYSGDAGKQGSIIDTSGNILGKHRGISNYTVGQRRGLNVSYKTPLYVLHIDPHSGDITVGTKSELSSSEFQVRDIHLISGNSELLTGGEFYVKVRYRHPGLQCKILEYQDNVAKVVFTGDTAVISPGQAAVFYNGFPTKSNIEVIGGGTICD